MDDKPQSLTPEEFVKHIAENTDALKRFIEAIEECLKRIGEEDVE